MSRQAPAPPRGPGHGLTPPGAGLRPTSLRAHGPRSGPPGSWPPGLRARGQASATVPGRGPGLRPRPLAAGPGFGHGPWPQVPGQGRGPGPGLRPRFLAVGPDASLMITVHGAGPGFGPRLVAVGLRVSGSGPGSGPGSGSRFGVRVRARLRPRGARTWAWSWSCRGFELEVLGLGGGSWSGSAGLRVGDLAAQGSSGFRAVGSWAGVLVPRRVRVPVVLGPLARVRFPGSGPVVGAGPGSGPGLVLGGARGGVVWRRGRPGSGPRLPVAGAWSSAGLGHRTRRSAGLGVWGVAGWLVVWVVPIRGSPVCLQAGVPVPPGPVSAPCRGPGPVRSRVRALSGSGPVSGSCRRLCLWALGGFGPWLGFWFLAVAVGVGFRSGLMRVVGPVLVEVRSLWCCWWKG
jgi:hypothetical protein